MRSKIVETQLKKCSYADLSHFDNTTGVFNIPKYSKPKFDIGKMYIIQVANELVDNNSSVIATNWNSGTSPKSPFLKIYVSKMVGKMIYVDSLVFNFGPGEENHYIIDEYLFQELLEYLKNKD